MSKIGKTVWIHTCMFSQFLFILLEILSLKRDSLIGERILESCSRKSIKLILVYIYIFFAKQELYYWLGLETPQFRPQVKQNCCYPRSQSITVLLCTFICFQNCLFPLTNKNYILPLTFIKSENLNEVTGSYFDIVTSKWHDLLNQ